MSIYATLKSDDPDWCVSVAVFLTDSSPVRVTHHEEDWFLSEEKARSLRRALNELFDDVTESE